MLETKSLAYKSILAPLSFTFLPERIYAIRGANGAGKTTLLKTVALLYRPTFGDVLFNGESLLQMTPLEVRRVLTFVPYEAPIHFNFTLREFLDMGFYPKAPDAKKREEVIALLSLSGKESRSIATLSSGEKRRAYFARAMLSEAHFFLLDEITTGVDEMHQELIWSLVHTLKKRGKTLLITLHDEASAKKHADEILTLSQGSCHLG